MTSAIAPPPVQPSNVDLDNAIAATAELAPKTTKRKLGSFAALLAFGALEASAGLFGTLFEFKRSNKVWYRLLSKSRLTPPDRTFSIVWPALYAASAYSAWRVWRSPKSASRTGALALWGVQLVTNAAWTPLFFGRKRPRLALADLALLGGSLAAFAITARKVDRTASWLTVPYLAWVGFAGHLNGSVITRNAGGLRGLLVRG